MRIRTNRKSFYLSTTFRIGPMRKNPDDDGMEVGAGFNQGVATVPDPPAPAEEENNDATDKDAGQAEAESGEGDGSEADAGEGDGEEGDDPPAKPEKKPKTLETRMKDLAKRDRETRRENKQLRAEMEALKNGGLPQNGGGDTQGDEKAAPDANDAKKYPLGVLDDNYIKDAIEFAADQKVAAALDRRLQSEREQAEANAAQAHLSSLKEKMDALTDAGTEQFDDFEETVVEAGLRGDWQLTEATFTAAAEADNGAQILYELSQDKKEAARVAKLSLVQQVKFVLQRDAEISGTKPAARTKPQAGQPPQAAPRGRNASSPIRADTDNLKDFKKLWYSDTN